MRMRRKSHLEERIAARGDYLLSSNGEDKNALLALQNKAYLTLSEVFNADKPLVLEIGCGKGVYSITAAKTRPDINYLAIEKIENVLICALESAAVSNLNNLKFLRTSAECLPRYLRDNSVSQIIINFPTPLPKQGYASQRLTSPRLLGIYKELLISGGSINLKTDNMPFFEYSIKTLTDEGFDIIFSTRDLHSSGKPNIVTEYESKFVALGLPIYFLTAKINKNS